MNVRTIKNDGDYASAMARLSELMGKAPKSGSEEEAELDLLALVIEDFERKTVPPVSPDPIEAILFRMDQMKMTKRDLVPFLGAPSKVSEVLARKRPLSLSMVRRLHKGLGIPAEVLITDAEDLGMLEADDEKLDYSRFPLKEMLARGCFGDFKGGLKRLKDEAEEQIRKLKKGVRLSQTKSALLRAPQHQGGAKEMDEYALLAWKCCVLKKARVAPKPRPFRKGSITKNWCRDLVKLSILSDSPRLAVESLGMRGITLVIEPHFKKTYLDGAAILDGDQPVVAMTLRHSRLDNFWFVLMHELAHVSLHLDKKNDVFIDDLDIEQKAKVEVEADEFAQDVLIPRADWARAEVRKTILEKDAVELAEKLGIHPSIVAGRLRHDKRDYSLLPGLNQKIK